MLTWAKLVASPCSSRTRARADALSELEDGFIEQADDAGALLAVADIFTGANGRVSQNRL